MSKRVKGLECTTPSRTHQEFKDECDINRIMAQSVKTGVVPQKINPGEYGDFSDVEDFQAAQELIKRSEAQFAAFSSTVRTRFDNSPAKFLEFVHSRDCTADVLHDLGLLDAAASGRVLQERAAKAAKAAKAGEPKAS